jgi:hypothetical protein
VIPVRRHYIAAGACIVLLAVSLLGSVQAHARPAEPTGSLVVSGTSAYGSTVTAEVAWADVRRNQNVRVQLLCMQDIGVVYGDVRDVKDPQTVSFVLGSPEQGTSVWDGSPARCRVDLYAVAPSREITYLAWSEVADG